MIKRRRLFVSLVMLFGLGAMISATGFQGQGNQKPFRQWTTEEAEAVLYPAFFGWVKGTTKFEFDVAKMIVSGQVAF